MGTVAIGALSQAGCELVIPALNTRGATETTAVCSFCGVGCGQVVSSRDGAVINLEGAAVTRDQGQVTMRGGDIALARPVGPSVCWCRLVRSRFYLHRF
jgi:anaerobic selenocysteine-containing dehydrogenase